MRDEFEDWCQTHTTFSTSQCINGDYQHPTVAILWAGWAAAWERQDELYEKHRLSQVSQTG